MKNEKLVSLFVAICVCLSFSVVLTACDRPGSDEQQSETEEDTSLDTKGVLSGWLLPQKIKLPMDNKNKDIDLVWAENSCTFTVEDTTYLFAYDAVTGGFDVSVDGGTDYSFDDLCVFDAEGRLTEINFEEQRVLNIAYDNGKMMVAAWGEGEMSSPIEISADWNQYKMPMPPFDDPEDCLYFTEWGDLCGGEDRTIYAYEYDEKGNILKVTSVDLGDYAMEFAYGDAPMTASWQRVPLKFILTWVLGRPLATFAMDVLCLSVYQQHGVQ